MSFLTGIHLKVFKVAHKYKCIHALTHVFPHLPADPGTKQNVCKFYVLFFFIQFPFFILAKLYEFVTG